jgi:hypothetical protein
MLAPNIFVSKNVRGHFDTLAKGVQLTIYWRNIEQHLFKKFKRLQHLLKKHRTIPIKEIILIILYKVTKVNNSSLVFVELAF